MPSAQAIAARRSLAKEHVDPERSVEDERRDWNEWGRTLSLSPRSTMEIIDLDGVSCACLRPKAGTARATIVYAHGGGLTTGSILTHRAFASELSVATTCEVILPDYRLLPENEASAPSDDVFKVFTRVAAAVAVDSHPLFLGGDSSGGGLALTVAKLAVDRNVTAPSGCFAISGAFDATLSSDSHTVNDDVDPILSFDVLRHWQTQLGPHVDCKDPRISPMFSDLRRLPPTLLLAGTDEVWLDDTRRMYALLMQSGCDCEMKIFDGMWHVWPMTSGLPETADALRTLANFIGRQREP